MRKLPWLVLACGLLPVISLACGSDKETNGGTGSGNTTSKGGKSSTSTGGKGSGNEPTVQGGADSVAPQGGGNDVGQGGAPEVAACDLSGDGKEVVDIISPIDFDVTLTADKVWRISDYVFVKDGATLTIDPCTRIVGDGSKVSALFVTRGAKIMAEGTENAPILFTSEQPEGERQPGDWGGVALLGKGITNDKTAVVEGVPNRPDFTYGGDDPADNSGVMKYVRIEYAGYAISMDSELNGLTLGAVGSGTTISHIQVSNSLDDCFEWFGGSVDVDHLVCNSDGDDMFDADRGYTGTMSYLFGRKRNNPSPDPNGFEWDNSKANESAKPRTTPTVKNATTCGFGFDTGANGYGALLRRGTYAIIDNWVETGFDFGVDVRDSSPAGKDSLSISNSTMFGNVEGGVADPADCSGVPMTDPNDPTKLVACGNSVTWDSGFDEDAWFNGTDANYPDNVGNSTDDPGFTVDDCQADGGPNQKVTGSGTGAFVDGNWLKGAWLDWADE